MTQEPCAAKFHDVHKSDFRPGNLALRATRRESAAKRQLQATTFTGPNGSWGTSGHHTAIVTRVSGATVTLVEQNVNGVTAVKVNAYDFSWPHSGTYIVYRAESR
jgi:hypothetical protein